jgi:hypothetical protein
MEGKFSLPDIAKFIDDLPDLTNAETLKLCSTFSALSNDDLVQHLEADVTPEVLECIVAGLREGDLDRDTLVVLLVEIGRRRSPAS